MVEVDPVANAVNNLKLKLVLRGKYNPILNLLVKKMAQIAMNLCISTAESKGITRCSHVSLMYVMVFLHIVIKRVEYVNIIAEAAPLVTVTP